MHIVVTTDTRIPVDIATGFQVEQWSPDEFYMRASDDEGLEIDDALWYDVADITQEIYEALEAYIDAGIKIIYYRFDDRSAPNFKITHDIIVYPSQPEMSEETPVEEDEVSVEYEEPTYEEPVEEVYEEPPQPPTQQIPTQQIPTKQTSTQQQNQETIYQPPIYPSNVQLANMSNMLQYDDYDSAAPQANRKAAPAKVILFGSSKGGTGKTFTCLISAYWYAKTHPMQRIALADFDIIDGQIGITINKLTPTMQDFYKQYHAGHKEYSYLDNCKVKSDHFSPNIDIYLAPSQDIPQVTNDNEYWKNVFELLIKNYDVVFFDSGIDYIGKPPISMLYKIADKIIITSNPSINSVKSVIKQFKTLSGMRANNVFRAGDNILSKVNVVLTRVYENETVNSIVIQNISKFAPIVAKFGNIDDIISEVQWYQHWYLIDNSPDITASLNAITQIEGE